ncbi:MAG: protein kinase [Ardenticatenaceae bacterium]|nr:protein kinase [Ardenticatenaceae bacterium]
MPQQPTQIGRYEIIEEIGRGGMATVYRAQDPMLRREVALKIISPQLSVDRKFVQRFQREARIVARVEHPQIVSIFDSGEFEGRPYIVMRLLDGGTLRQKIDSGPLPVDEVYRFLLQISDALHTAHQNGIIHRDIKPSNIIFDRRGKAFVSDFGIAKLVDSHTNLTGTRMVGTPSYMSPEQFQGGEIDGRTDQYSLAVVAYEALSGHPPFEGEMMTLAYKHVNEPVPPLRESAANVPAGLVKILERALNKRPSDRFPNLNLMHQTILALTLGQPGVSQSPAPTPPPKFDPSVTSTAPATPSAMAEMYRESITAIQSNHLGKAQKLLSKIFNENPRYKDVGQKLHQVETALATQIRFQGAAGSPKIPETQNVAVTPLPEDKETKTRWPLWVGLAVLLVLLIGGGAYGFSSGFFGGGSDTATPTSEIAALPSPTDLPSPSNTPAPPTEPPATPTVAVVATEPAAAADPNRESTATPSPTAEAEIEQPTTIAAPSETPTLTPSPTSSQATGPASSGGGLPLTFDGGAFGIWVRGDEPNGEISQASNISRSGQAARIDYQFISTANDYVVFLQNNPVSGEPNQIQVWVYGDGSGHFLNAWIRDSEGQTWQVPFGRVTHNGWQQMTGVIDTEQDWPWTHISGNNDEEVDYPITLRGFVLDDISDSYSGSGSIYLDDVTVGSGAISPPGGSGESPSPTATVGSGSSGDIGQILYTSGNILLTTDPSWSSPVEVGTAVQTTCSGTPSTVDGTTFSVSRGFYCGLSEGVSVCQAPNGAVEVIFNGNYSDGFFLTIRAVGAEGGGDYIFDSKDFDLSEGLRWSPNSDSFMFVLGDTVYMGYTNRLYQPLFSPAYNPIFSPDGSQILYRKPIGPGINDVFVADATGENQRNVTNISTVDKSCAVWVR